MSKHARPISLPLSHVPTLLHEHRPPEAVAYRFWWCSATESAWFPPLDEPPLACLHKAEMPKDLPPGRLDLHFYDQKGDEVSIGPPPQLWIQDGEASAPVPAPVAPTRNDRYLDYLSDRRDILVNRAMVRHTREAALSQLLIDNMRHTSDVLREQSQSYFEQQQNLQEWIRELTETQCASIMARLEPLAQKPRDAGPMQSPWPGVLESGIGASKEILQTIVRAGDRYRRRPKTRELVAAVIEELRRAGALAAPAAPTGDRTALSPPDPVPAAPPSPPSPPADVRPPASSAAEPSPAGGTTASALPAKDTQPEAPTSGAAKPTPASESERSQGASAPFRAAGRAKRSLLALCAGEEPPAHGEEEETKRQAQAPPLTRSQARRAVDRVKAEIAGLSALETAQLLSSPQRFASWLDSLAEVCRPVATAEPV